MGRKSEINREGEGTKHHANLVGNLRRSISKILRLLIDKKINEIKKSTKSR
jgi:hypothetical protein